MKKKLLVLVAVAAMAAMVALFGCSSGGSAASSSAAGSESAASSESAAASEAAGSEAAEAGEFDLLTDGTIVFATSPDYPPFENLENGEYVGLDIAIAQAIGEELGLQVEFKSLQFDAIIPAIAAGGQADAGISGFSVDPERAKEIDFTEAYYIDDQAVAVMNTSDITADNADEALNADGIIIAVQSGTTGEDYVKENFPNATVQPYGNSTDAFAAMQAGQADAVCTNYAVVKKMIADAYQDATIVKSVATGEEYAIVVSQDNPQLTAAINAALAKLTEDGTIDALVEQYMS